jgi:hypothetical protein
VCGRRWLLDRGRQQRGASRSWIRSRALGRECCEAVEKNFFSCQINAFRLAFEGRSGPRCELGARRPPPVAEETAKVGDGVCQEMRSVGWGGIDSGQRRGDGSWAARLGPGRPVLACGRKSGEKRRSFRRASTVGVHEDGPCLRCSGVLTVRAPDSEQRIGTAMGRRFDSLSEGVRGPTCEW